MQIYDEHDLHVRLRELAVLAQFCSITWQSNQRYVATTIAIGQGMAVPDFQTMMLPMLQLAGNGKVHSLSEARYLSRRGFRRR